MGWTIRKVGGGGWGRIEKIYTARRWQEEISQYKKS
jgi:hypothetical protein